MSKQQRTIAKLRKEIKNINIQNQNALNDNKEVEKQLTDIQVVLG